ncbi:MAG: 50S ribosomal protein L13 [Patescibacteria group bacterium]
MTQPTKSTKSQSASAIQRAWHLVDLKDQVLGRTTGEIAKFLQGKHKVSYTTYLDSGDHVVVINARDLVLTGRKMQQKEYKRYSGYPGGLKSITAERLVIKNAKEMVRHAVSGMLPKNKLRDRRLARLHIYEGSDHPYSVKFQIKNSK